MLVSNILPLSFSAMSGMKAWSNNSSHIITLNLYVRTVDKVDKVALNEM